MKNHENQIACFLKLKRFNIALNKVGGIKMEPFNVTNIEVHPWNNQYIYEKSKILTLGTFPPRRFTVPDR